MSASTLRPGLHPDTPQSLRVETTEVDGGLRLDQVLARALATQPEALSRARIQALIRDGHVSRGGRTLRDPSARVKLGETYDIVVPQAEPAEPIGEQIPLQIVHEDDQLIVIDKPAGLVVHPAAGHQAGTLVNALIAHCGDSLSGIGGVKRPGIVHRLDKDTSGLLVVAKTDAAHQSLAAQFAAHGLDGRLERGYLALVWGVPGSKRGAIDAPLARATGDRRRIAVARGDAGRHAVTHFEVLETMSDEGGRPLASLVDLQLETGRTHQIRVHMTHIGNPVMGDPTYGSGFKASRNRLQPEARAALDELGRQALHAAVLGFEHPSTGKRLQFVSPLPGDLARLHTALGGRWRRGQASKPKRAR